MKIECNMYQNIRFYMGCIIGICLVATSAIASPELKKIQLDVGKNQIMLEFSELTDFKIFNLNKLKGFYRLVIDTPQFKTKIMESVPVSRSDFVTLIRYGSYTPQISRIVIETNKPITFAIDRIDKSPTSKKLYINMAPSAVFASNTIISKNWAAVELENTQAEKKRRQIQDRNFAKIKSQTHRVKPLIVMDAGHGGHDPGAIGLGNLYEKHVTLEIAQFTKKTLENTGKFKVILTRTEDLHIDLRERYAIAEKVRANFFISIHADKHSKSSVRGMSVYTLSDASRERESQRIKNDKIANESVKEYYGHTGGEDISAIIGDLGLEANSKASDRFAKILVANMQKNKIVTLSNPTREAGLAVLKSPAIPSVLIESAYMSNKYDVINLQSSRWRKRFATALANTIIEYYEQYPLQQ